MAGPPTLREVRVKAAAAGAHVVGVEVGADEGDGIACDGVGQWRVYLSLVAPLTGSRMRCLLGLRPASRVSV